MGKIIRHIIAEIGIGVGQVLVISPDRQYIRPSKKAFLKDNANLRKDAKRVGSNLTANIKQYS